MSKRLILASKSAARARMLRACGLDPDVMPTRIDERNVERDSDDATQAARRLAQAKARGLGVDDPNILVLGADQSADFAGLRLHKSASLGALRAQLLMMSGKSHSLTSACAGYCNGEMLFVLDGQATVYFRDFSETFVDAYLGRVGDLALESVGGYQIEGLGIQLIERLDGDWPTVIGLPLMPLLKALRRYDVLPT